jgi:DNA-binding XRE family transcriptional regulator
MALSEARRAEMARKGAVELTVQEWLGLSDAEMIVIEIHVRLSREVKRAREAAGLTQKDLAERMKVAQPRIAKIERGGRGVSLDHLVSAFLTAGGTLAELAAIVVASTPPAPVAGRAVVAGSSG